ncbi:hypothetical protein SAMN05444673_4578 [Bacillus sp. OV166]|nr:hypothetical protein SAMN05444673_4578 [Bacillus sp. OV166]
MQDDGIGLTFLDPLFFITGSDNFLKFVLLDSPQY